MSLIYIYLPIIQKSSQNLVNSLLFVLCLLVYTYLFNNTECERQNNSNHFKFNFPSNITENNILIKTYY